MSVPEFPAKWGTTLHCTPEEFRRLNLKRAAEALGERTRGLSDAELDRRSTEVDPALASAEGERPAKKTPRTNSQRGAAYRETHRERYGRHYRRRSGRAPGRCRKDSVIGNVQYKPLTFTQRTWLIKLARWIDRQTHRPRQHGGDIKRTGLAVMAALLFDHHNEQTGQCDPSVATLVESANADGISERAAYDAIDRLEALGLLIRIRRAVWEIDKSGRRFLRQDSNAYIFDTRAVWRRWQADCKRCGETPRESLYNKALRCSAAASASSADVRSPTGTTVAPRHGSSTPEIPD